MVFLCKRMGKGGRTIAHSTLQELTFQNEIPIIMRDYPQKFAFPLSPCKLAPIGVAKSNIFLVMDGFLSSGARHVCNHVQLIRR